MSSNQQQQNPSSLHTRPIAMGLKATVALACVLACLFSQAKANVCASFCAFRWCDANGLKTFSESNKRTLILRDENTGSIPFVCRRFIKEPGQDISESVRISKVGQAEVHPFADVRQDPAPFVKIAKYRPEGLSPRFRSDYFTLRSIQFPPVPGEKGLARKGSVGNQEEFMDDLCMLLPIKKYNVLADDGTVLREVTTNERNDCIAARVRAPVILIELTWNSDDDFDLEVTEPNGEKLSFRNRRSATKGKYISEVGTGSCSSQNTDGREQVRWLPNGNAEDGRYRFKVTHFRSCGFGSTTWNLAVIVNGKVVQNKRGQSDKGNGEKVTQGSFIFSS